MRFTRPQAGLVGCFVGRRAGGAPSMRYSSGCAGNCVDFAGIEAAEPPPQFPGELRGYQREGLGWLYFLQRFGFGGCLADDMGLGKTIQVLALLEARRELPPQWRRKFTRRLTCRRAALAGVSLEKRSGALCPQFKNSRSHRRGAAETRRSLRRIRCRADHLRHLAQRRAAFQGYAFRLLHSRRSPGDQKRRHAWRPRRCACSRPIIAWR